MERILVLDFGGQYNQLIARRVRDLGVYAEILPYTVPLERVRAGGYRGVIFTGGPNSVYDPASPHYDPAILSAGLPLLGICYGCQLIAHMAGGAVETAETSEYGRVEWSVKKGTSELFRGVPGESVVWMSHTDRVTKLPFGFEVTSSTANCPVASMENGEKKIIVVRTRGLPYRRKEKPSRMAKIVYRKYPALVESMQRIGRDYNLMCEELEERAQKKEIFMIAPSRSVDISRFEGDMEKLGELYWLGYHDMENRIDELREYLALPDPAAAIV